MVSEKPATGQGFRPLYHGIPILLALAGGNPGPVIGSASDTIHLREVEIIHAVPVHKAPLISSSLDTVTMDLMAGRSLSELLAFQPSVHIKSSGRGSLSTASFRGTDASHTKVYWNGIRLNSAMLGQVDFSLVPVWFLDEVSLLYGGSSLSEGSGALGGAILLESVGDWNDGLSISLNQEIGSYGTFGSYGRLAAGDDRVRSDTRLYWTRSRNDYPFLNTDVLPQQEQRLEEAGYANGGFLQEIRFRPGKRQELAARLWYQESERELPALMSQEGASREENQSDRNLRGSLEWKIYPGFGSLMLRTAFTDTRMHYYLHHTYLDYRQFDSRSAENSMYNTMQADIRTGSRTRIGLRADFNRHHAAILDRVRDEGYSHLRNEGSFTLSAHRESGRRWILYALLRQEWSDGQWLPLMPSAGFRYRITAKDRLWMDGNLSRNYNLPTLNDLYWIPGGNPDLRPENSFNGDLSLTYREKGERFVLEGSLHAFAAWVEDWILWKPTRFRYWEAENLATVFSRGTDVQLGGDLHLGRWLLTLKAGYAYTRSTNQGAATGNDLSRGRQLIYIPVHAAHGYFNLTRAGYSLNWSAGYTGTRYTQPGSGEYDFTEVLNPYALHDIHLGKSWNIRGVRSGFRLSIYNLFNTSYQAIRSRPMPGRNVALTINIRI